MKGPKLLDLNLDSKALMKLLATGATKEMREKNLHIFGNRLLVLDKDIKHSLKQ